MKIGDTVLIRRNNRLCKGIIIGETKVSWRVHEERQGEKQYSLFNKDDLRARPADVWHPVHIMKYDLEKWEEELEKRRTVNTINLVYENVKLINKMSTKDRVTIYNIFKKYKEE